MDQFQRVFTPLLPAVSKVYRLSNYLRLTYHKRMTTRIIGNTAPPVYFDSDRLFSKLQSTYPSRSNYFYDGVSAWKRGVERAQKILELTELQKTGLNVLEIACGDGMTGSVLSHYGHSVFLNDMSDWRDPRAKDLVYIEGDICGRLPVEGNLFDLVISYNSFEHLEKPALAMAEIYRLLKPDGMLVLEFGPLFSSPWGLHAYRTIHVPYAQFLFSQEFLSRKFQEVGLIDLGKELDTLQPLNRWRITQFDQLWEMPGYKVLNKTLYTDSSHLGIVLKYPRSFSGLGLEIKDLTTHGISVRLRKTGSYYADCHLQ